MSNELSNPWIDISVPVRNGMVHWPGDPPFRIERVQDLDLGDICTVSRMTLGVHTGTHMDAPLHFIPHAPSIDTLPLDATLGPARVIGIRDPRSITRAELTANAIVRGERLLFKTANSNGAWTSDAFDENFVCISEDGARYLAERQVRTVGVDYLSVGCFKSGGPETHRILLAAGIWIIEGLNLGAVEPGDYELVCLPLKLIGAEGAPARAVVRKNIPEAGK